MTIPLHRQKKANSAFVVKHLSKRLGPGKSTTQLVLLQGRCRQKALCHHEEVCTWFKRTQAGVSKPKDLRLWRPSEILDCPHEHTPRWADRMSGKTELELGKIYNMDSLNKDLK